MTSKDTASVLRAVAISFLFGVLGFFLTFFLGEVIFANTNEPALFASLSLYNFIVCLFITKAYPKSIWFAGFLINIMVWGVLISNLRGPGGFVDLWYGWTAMVIFAYAGSFVGLVLSRRKRKQVDANQEKE
jgi:hypothetical protein